VEAWKRGSVEALKRKQSAWPATAIGPGQFDHSLSQFRLETFKASIIFQSDMSAIEILSELPKLTHVERREIARRLLELEAETQILADCDSRANDNFLLLDAMEAEDARNQRR